MVSDEVLRQEFDPLYGWDKPKKGLFEDELDKASVLESIYYRDKNYQFVAESRHSNITNIGSDLKDDELIGVHYKFGIITSKSFHIRFRTKDLIAYNSNPEQVFLYVKPHLIIWFNLYSDVTPLFVEINQENYDKFIAELAEIKKQKTAVYKKEKAADTALRKKFKSMSKKKQEDIERQAIELLNETQKELALKSPRGKIIENVIWKKTRLILTGNEN